MKAIETSSIHLKKKMEVEAGRSARTKMGTNAEMRREDPVHLGNSNSSSRLKEKGCREEEESKIPWKAENLTSRKPGNRPESNKRKQPGTGPRKPGGSLKRKGKRWSRESPAEKMARWRRKEEQKVEEKKESEKEGKGRKSRQAQEEGRIQEKGVVEEVQRYHQENRNKAGKEGRKDTGEEKEKTMECGQNREMVFLTLMIGKSVGVHAASENAYLEPNKEDGSGSM